MSDPSDPVLAELLRHLDTISDGDLGTFAGRVRSMPSEQMQWLVETWPKTWDLEPKPVNTGAIRPLAGAYPRFTEAVSVALPLLLYVDQVALPGGVLMPTQTPNRLGDDVARSLGAWQEHTARLVEAISDVRPLIEDDSIIFMPTWHPQSLWDEMSTLQRLWPELDFELLDDFYLLAEPTPVLESRLANALRTLLRDLATPLDTDEWVVALNRSLPHRHHIDPRHGEAANLVSLSTRQFDLPFSDLVVLRQHSESWAQLRAALREALRGFSDMPGDIESLSVAKRTVADQLRRDLESVDREIKQSQFLSSAAALRRRIAFVGLGAAPGVAMAAAMGTPLVGALSGAAGGAAVGLAETVREALAARAKRRSGRAIQAVITAFEK